MTSAIFQTVWTDVSLKSDVGFRNLIIFAVNKIRCIGTNLYRFFGVVRDSHVEKFVNI